MFYRFLALFLVLAASAHAGNKPLVVLISDDIYLDDPSSEQNNADLIHDLMTFQEELEKFAATNYDRGEIQYDTVENPLVGTTMRVFGLREDSSAQEFIQILEKLNFRILDSSYAWAGGELFFNILKHYPVAHRHFAKEGVLDYLMPKKNRLVNLDGPADEDPKKAAAIQRAADATWEEIFQPLTDEILSTLEIAGLKGELTGKGVLYQGEPYSFLLDEAPGALSHILGHRSRAIENLWIVAKTEKARGAIENALKLNSGEYGNFDVIVLTVSDLDRPSDLQRLGVADPCANAVDEEFLN